MNFRVRTSNMSSGRLPITIFSLLVARPQDFELPQVDYDSEQNRRLKNVHGSVCVNDLAYRSRIASLKENLRATFLNTFQRNSP